VKRLAILPTCGALLFFSLSACHANLGDSEAQCIARYGAEADVQDAVGYRQVGDKAATFHLQKANLAVDIRVIFLHGLSCHESFSNSDASRGLSESQMQTILDAQSAGLKWRKVHSIFRTDRVDSSGTTSGSEEWLRSDGATGTFWLSTPATSQSVSGQVEVSTKEYTVAQRYYDKQNGDL
jgi:hypothetical protein